MTVLVVTLSVVLALVVVLVAGLLRSHADILRALHSLGITEEELRGGHPSADGVHAPAMVRTQPGVPTPRSAGETSERGQDLSGATPTGGATRVAVTDVAHTTLLAFLSSSCLTCREFWQAFAHNPRLPGADTRLVVVTQGADAETPSAVAALAPPDVTVVMSTEAWNDYAVPVSPYFLLVDGPSGAVIGEGAASSWDKVVDLLGRAVADADATARRNRPGATTGPAPKVHAPRGEREADTDAALAAAGIEPDDPRLHHRPDGSTR